MSGVIRMDNLARLPDDLEGEPEPEELPTTKDIELDPPIEFQKKAFAVLHLSEPTGKQVETAEQELANGPNAYTLRRYQITLIAQNAHVPREVVQAMRVGQIEEAFDFLGDMLQRGRRTGAN